MKYEKLLDHAKRSLIEGRPDDALAAVKKLSENPALTMKADPEKVRSILRHLIELAEAGGSGVAAARERLSAAQHASTRLPTYTKSGAVEMNDLSIKKPMRF